MNWDLEAGKEYTGYQEVRIVSKLIIERLLEKLDMGDRTIGVWHLFNQAINELGLNPTFVEFGVDGQMSVGFTLRKRWLLKYDDNSQFLWKIYGEFETYGWISGRTIREALQRLVKEGADNEFI